MNIQIIGRKDSGTCSISQRKNVEVWMLRVNGGPVQQIGTPRILECLRMLSAAGPNSSEAAANCDAPKHKEHAS